MPDKSSRGISNLPVAIPDVPDAPTVSASNVGTSRAFNNGAATVTIASPTGGLPASYSITTTPATTTTTATSSPVTLTGLASATSYTVTATPTNVSATGPSTTSSSITATTVPQAPTIGAAADGGTGTTATVAYTAGATGGSAITTFTATSSPGSLTGTGASPITVSGLTTGTAYTFTVTATNANGTSTASAASNSVTPVNPPSFESIATLTPSGVSTITFSSIPSTYQHLQIRIIGRTDYTSTNDSVSVRFNGDTGSNYSYHAIQGAAGAVSTNGAASQTSILLNNGLAGGEAGASVFGADIIDIHDYASTSKNKTLRALNGRENNTSVSVIGIRSGAWYSTSAVTSITLFFNANAQSGSVFSLYGIKGA